MTGPTPVRIGQIWQDNDPRHQEGSRWSARFVQVFTLVDGYAECYAVDADGKLTERDDKRYRNGTPRRIRLDRFRPTSTGYRLHRDAEPEQGPETRQERADDV